MTQTSRTPYAELTRTSQDILEIRFTPGTVLNTSGIATVIGERKRLCEDRPTGLLLIVPSDVELDIGIIDTDHLKVNHATDRVLGFAVVAGSVMAETLLRLYKAYYPTPFQADVFTDEAEARAWLGERVAEALKA